LTACRQREATCSAIKTTRNLINFDVSADDRLLPYVRQLSVR